MRVSLLHNAEAGDENQPDAHQLCALIRKAGHAVSYHRAHDSNWEAALSEPSDLIAVAGGDGTIGRVARHMVGNAKPLAILPMGTANNISRTLGIAERPLVELITGWKGAFERNFEVGVVRGPFGERRFAEGVGAGVFAWTIPDADASATLANLTHTDHKITYALQMLKDRLAQCSPVRLAATLDGDDLSGEYVLFEAMITRYIGPNLYLAPQSATADGLLDVVMVTEAERGLLRDYLESWQAGERQQARMPARKGRRLALQWTGFRLHIDDDVWPDHDAQCAPVPSRIEIGIEGKPLRVLVPASQAEHA
jgi:diacylglycerol kinase family enzyme